MVDQALVDRASSSQAAADQQQQAADRLDQQADQKERDRDAAVAAANDPNATQAQRDAAVQATQDAATAREAATAAQQQANAAQADALRAGVALAQAQVAEAAHSSEHKVNGFYLGTNESWYSMTEADWKAMIVQNMQVKCVGPEHKKVCGFTMDAIIGAKTEFCLGGKVNLISPIEHKHVAGSSNTTILGIKHDFVGGAKWDQQVGAKYETHIGHKATTGPSETTKYPENESVIGRIMTKGLVAFHKIAKEEVKAVKLSETIGSRREKVANMRRAVRSMTVKMDSLKSTANSFAVRGAQVTMKFKNSTYSARFSAKMKGESAEGELNGSFARISKGGGKVEIWNLFIIIDGSMIRFK